MPSIPISSAAGYLGVFFLLVGFFLIAAGTGILKIEKITVTIGRRTWVLGLLCALAGIVFLFVDVRSPENPAKPPTPSSAGTQPQVEFDPTHQAVLVYKVIVDMANVYTEPDTTSSVVESAAMDQVVEVLDMREDWLLVTYLIGTVRTTGWMELGSLEIVR